MSLERIVKKRIGHMEAGQTAFNLITQRFTYHSKELWTQYFNEGRILINQQKATLSTIIQRDDILEYYPPELPEPEVERQYSIIFEDDDLLVINKPANLPCHPSGKFFKNTLWGILKEQNPDLPIRIIHRLDRETSGIVIVAKTENAAKSCQAQFSHRTTQKHYLTIVEGLFPQHLLCDGFLGPDNQSQIRKKRRFYKKEEVSTLEASQLESATTNFFCRAQQNNLSLLEVIPKTGRLHQIRATLRTFNYPIIGDKLYGVDENLYIRFITHELSDKDIRILRCPFQALHAWKLTIFHPSTNQPTTFIAPFPKMFEPFFSSLNFY